MKINDAIIITKEDYMNAITKTLNNENVKKVSSNEPMLFMAFVAYSMELFEELFRAGEEKEDSEAKEDENENEVSE